MRLVVGNYNYSSWSLRAWLAALSCEPACEVVRVPLYGPDSKAQLKQHSTWGRVPCLHDDGLIVWDSLAICEYLAEKQPALWPADRAARAVARSVSAEMHSSFRDLRINMPMNIRKDYAGKGRTPEVLDDIARITAIWSDCRARFGAGGPWLFGQWSIADCMFGPVAFRFATYAVQPEGAAGEYLQALLGHPLMQQWRALALAESERIASEDLYD